MADLTILTITLPPEIARDAQRTAREENRTLDDLVGEALRRYQTDRHWEKIRAYAEERNREHGYTEADVERLIHEERLKRRGEIS
jgi:predicted transcriptional regulator